MRLTLICASVIILTACADSRVSYISIDPQVKFDEKIEYVKDVLVSDSSATFNFNQKIIVYQEIRDGLFRGQDLDAITLHEGESFSIQGVGSDKFTFIGKHNGSYVVKHFNSRTNKTYVIINKIRS